MRVRVVLLAGTVALACCAACGDNADLEVRGAHQTYVVSRQSIPLTNTEAREVGMDLNGDGSVDNQTGMVLSTFHGYGLDTQDFTDRLIDRGSLIQLLDIQMPGPRDRPAAAGIATLVGSNPRPEPCATIDDTVCREHLQGDGVFDIDPSSVIHPPVPVFEDGAHWVGQGGALSVMTGFFDAPIQLDFAGARVSFETDGGTAKGKIAGGVSRDDLREKLIPAAMSLVSDVVRRDCLALDMPPACGCKANTNGKTLLGLFDTTHDCMVTFDEISSNSLIVSLTAPDVTLDGEPYLSFGFGFEAVPASI